MTRIIRKEIVINAPPAKVWEHITDPAKIAGWLMPTNFAAQVGSGFVMECGTVGQISGVVTEVVPLKKLVYSWNSPVVNGPTTVTITLTEENGKTRLVLEHAGWQIPPMDREAADEHDRGWDEHLRSLQNQLSGADSRK